MALFGVVTGKWQAHDARGAVGFGEDALGELQDGELFVRVGAEKAGTAGDENTREGALGCMGRACKARAMRIVGALFKKV